ncbi:DUF6161 domain-containing protein [Flavobacterium sp.]|uniref:DUF6161 domain-containing protein n=1 Tax=Flavobacterium sp. TaxID=239 RepID=UPI00261B57DD|nr:DUF6161 domain-containing protein [Flavobacterium sp.]
MKNAEFKKALNLKLEESILRNQTYTLKIPAENYEASFDLIGLHRIVEEKKKKWEQEVVPTEFSSSSNFFNNLLISIENSTLDTQTDTTFHRNIINSLDRAGNNVLFPDSPKSLFLQNLHSNYPKYFNGAFAVVNGTIDYGQLSRADYFKGVFLALKFETQGTDTLSSEEADRKSFTEFKTEFENEKIGIMTNFDSIIEATQTKSNQEIENLKGLFNDWNLEYGSQLDELKTQAKNELNKANMAGKFLLKKSLDKKIQLEQTYREQMRFKAPAEYWKERATFLNAEGKKFLHWLIALVVLGTVILFSLLWLTPEDMLISIFSSNPAKAVRWSIIFITMISLLFLGIQAVKKAMFSSYHLARDAEEREKLTVFYLSLIKDSTITQEDRSLVLQALFSRADTGMLKDEASPTMPGILDKIK